MEQRDKIVGPAPGWHDDLPRVGIGHVPLRMGQQIQEGENLRRRESCYQAADADCPAKELPASNHGLKKQGQPQRTND